MCNRSNCRHVEVGDMVVEHGIGSLANQSWCGIVVGVNRFRRISIVWNKPNPNYTEKHGYYATNIHNLRSRYEVYKGNR